MLVMCGITGYKNMIFFSLVLSPALLNAIWNVHAFSLSNGTNLWLLISTMPYLLCDCALYSQRALALEMHIVSKIF
jgi:hypothetical protein